MLRCNAWEFLAGLGKNAPEAYFGNPIFYIELGSWVCRLTLRANHPNTDGTMQDQSPGAWL